MSDPTMKLAVEALSHLSITQWLDTLAAQTRLGDVSSSRSGAFYLPVLQQRSQQGGQYGGFFAPVSHTNYETTVATLFADSEDKGQWLLDYLAKGAPTSLDTMLGTRKALTPQQQLFVKRFDEVMVGFLDGNLADPKSRALRSFELIATFYDETLTDKELYQVINRIGMQEDLKQMGDPLGMQWVMFTGGVVQGIADFEAPPSASVAPGTRIASRYSPSEFRPFYSPAAQTALFNANRNTIGGWGKSSFADGLPDYVGFMESICGSNPDWIFSPSATPAYTPPAAARQKD